MNIDNYEMVANILRRPSMYCRGTCLREILFFVSGVSYALEPAEVDGALCGFPSFVVLRFESSQDYWTDILEERFGDLPYILACSAVLELLEQWRKDHSK